MNKCLHQIPLGSNKTSQTGSGENQLQLCAPKGDTPRAKHGAKGGNGMSPNEIFQMWSSIIISGLKSWCFVVCVFKLILGFKTRQTLELIAPSINIPVHFRIFSDIDHRYIYIYLEPLRAYFLVSNLDLVW